MWTDTKYKPNMKPKPSSLQVYLYTDVLSVCTQMYSHVYQLIIISFTSLFQTILEPAVRQVPR